MCCGLADHTLLPYRIVIHGSVLFIGYLMNYVDEYPAKKLEHGIFLDFKLMGLEKISKIAYREYQKLGTGKLVQRIENGADERTNSEQSLVDALPNGIDTDIGEKASALSGGERQRLALSRVWF